MTAPLLPMVTVLKLPPETVEAEILRKKGIGGEALKKNEIISFAFHYVESELDRNDIRR